MGAGASAGIAAAASATSTEEMKAMFKELGPDHCRKIKAVLESLDEKSAVPKTIPVNADAPKMSLLAYGKPEFNEAASEGSLHRAAYKGDADELQKLLASEGVDLEKVISWSFDTAEDFGGTSENTDQSSSKVTALHIAVDRGHAECVKLLVQAGANVGAKCFINDCDEDDTEVEVGNLAKGKPEILAALGAS
eukprot:gnl/MRDRNA2_/MRDRNA2_26547_c0_seq1.p1 gnl/MRDRNA2_/MRDRNA2_26547_c0~~gnl/MRDRNA2_/MRDRNA2_26547_c0_seq1.p1  ORF type:complete len:193 (+),score=54.35 gnl/MRDRNA2_/MRDRNA2_26547_c0_seq1:104-682(+)